MGLKPCKQLQKTIQIIDYVFRYTRTPYFLHFGGLIAIAKKDGVVPDGDLDLCTYYEESHKWERIRKCFESKGFKMIKALQDDTNPRNILYCGFNPTIAQAPEDYEKEEFFPHMCLSFWYEHKGIRYYCHDQHHEISGGNVAVPPSGYFFKGFPAEWVQQKYLKRVEWPGIPGQYKISAPMLPFLEYMYPGWIYNQQRYMVDRKNTVEPNKLRDLCRTGASSPWMVHVKSMNDWKNEAYINSQLEESRRKWDVKIKTMIKKP